MINNFYSLFRLFLFHSFHKEMTFNALETSIIMHNTSFVISYFMPPKVNAIMALIECKRFSACLKQ